ncbi:MAG: pilin, partial [Wohlfahrtiimonas sp.]
MRYPFVRLVVPNFIAVMIIAGFYIGRYVSPMYIPMIGIVHFLLVSLFIVLLNDTKCVRNQKGLVYILLGILLIHAVYFILLYVNSKPYRDGLEKDLNYLYALGLSLVVCGIWTWLCLPKKYLKSYEQPTLLGLFMINFLVFIVIMFTVPNYADYTDRTYIAEGMLITTAAKVASAEFYENEKRFPKDNQEAGLAESDQITGQSVKAIEVLPQGKIK